MLKKSLIREAFKRGYLAGIKSLKENKSYSLTDPARFKKKCEKSKSDKSEENEECEESECRSKKKIRIPSEQSEEKVRYSRKNRRKKSGCC